MGYVIFDNRVNTFTTGFNVIEPTLQLNNDDFVFYPNDSWILVETVDDGVLRRNETVLIYEFDSFYGDIDVSTEEVGTYVGALGLGFGFGYDSVVLDVGFGYDVFTNADEYINYTPYFDEVRSSNVVFYISVFPDTNEPPVAVDDVFYVRAGREVALDVLGNDYDPDGSALFLINALGSSHEDLSVENGKVVYEAPSGGLTSDFFVYGVEDVDGAYSIGTAIIEIYPESAFGLGLSINEAHSVAYLYEAGLNRDGNIDADGLNFWIDARENGLSEAALAQRFLDSPEFAAAFGDPDTLSDRGLVEVLYRNVLNRDGETGGIDFWTGVLAQPGFGRDDLLLAFAKSPENLDGSAFVEDLAEVAPGVWDFLG